MRKLFTKDNIKRFALLNLGILLYAIAIYFFQAPNGFAMGGISGLSIIFANVFPNTLSQAEYMLIMNIVLLIIGFIFLGKECGLLTAYCALTLSLENRLLELFFPFIGPLTHEPLLELVFVIIMTGIASAVIFRCKSTSGGTEIIAMILKKFTHMNVGTAVLCADIVITLATFVGVTNNGVVYFAAQTGMFSLLGLFAKVFVIDDFIESMNLCKAFNIITTKPDEIERLIVEEIKHGATSFGAKGVYSGEGRTVIMTVCKNSEAYKLRKRIKQIDPEAFLIVTKSSEIIGKGFEMIDD